MPFPTEQRFKLLQQKYADAEEIHAPAPSTKPQAVPCLIIDFITRSDTGDCLKAIPLSPKNISSSGELTFLDDTNPVPENAEQMFYIRVYPLDCKPGDVNGTYQVGQPILAFPYAMPGPNKGLIAWVCIEGGSGIPTGELQGMCFMNVTQNQMGSSYPFFHELI